MGKLREIAINLARINPDQALLESVMENEHIAIDLNTSQLERGQRSDGTTLPNYSPNSIAVFGKPDAPMTLFDTGDFYEGFYLDARGFPIQVESQDYKSGMLQQRYGIEIFGLQEENKSEFAKGHVLHSFVAKIKAAMDV